MRSVLIAGRYIPCNATGSVAILSELKRRASVENEVKLRMKRAPSKSVIEASCGKISVTNCARCPLAGSVMSLAADTNPDRLKSWREMVFGVGWELAKATPMFASPVCVFT